MPHATVCSCPLETVMGKGCKCGAFQAEQALKSQKEKRSGAPPRRDCAAINYLPGEGEIVVVRRPVGSNIDHGGIPLAIWHLCEGKQFEVLLSLWDDQSQVGGLALLDLAGLGKANDYWFPLDGIELP